MLRDLFSFKVNSKKSMKTFSETQRYAKAVYRLAYEAKSLDVLEKDFLNLKEILDQSADLKKFIKNPTYKYSVINNVIDALAKHFSFSDLFSRFLKVLNKNRRFFFLEKIVNNFFDLLLNERGEVLATLKLSHAISDSEKADIAKKIRWHFKEENQNFFLCRPIFISWFNSSNWEYNDWYFC